MKHHALLIGSQIRGLRGPHNDVAAMRSVLEARGFAVEARTGEGARRDDILAAYAALIERAQPGDAVVVYYTGHGGWAVSPEGQRVQFVMPTDYVDDPATFRGITDGELSDLLAQLTARTRNATVILDCCHASLMSRDPAGPPPGVVERSQPVKFTPGMAARLAGATRRAYTGNPDAVRVVATAPDRAAYEADELIGKEMVRRGFLTRALELELAEPGADRLSWGALILRVRERVLARHSMQVPEVEGPADRVLFTTGELRRPDAVVYVDDDGVPSLRASRAQGARVGARYRVVRRGATALAPETQIAIATVTELDGASARVELSEPAETPTTGCLAFPEVTPFPPLRVATDDDGIATRLAASPFAQRVAEAAAQIVLARRGPTLIYTDRRELPAYELSFAGDAAGVDKAVAWIERWAKADALRTLPSEGLRVGAAGAPGVDVEVAWGAVESGVAVARRAGDGLKVGDRLWVTATNRSTAPLYAWVFDIGVSGRVALLSIATQQLATGQAVRVGFTDAGAPDGLAMGWARDLTARVGPRRESVVVLVANHWIDVRVFETPYLEKSATRGGPAALEDTLRALGGGTSRDASRRAEDQRFGVHAVDFDFSPGGA